MSTDPVRDFAQQLAVQLASGAVTGVWARVKEWIARRRRSAPIVAQFEREPKVFAPDLADLLRQLQFDIDPDGRMILADGLTPAVSQTASGHFVVQVGGDVGAIHMAPPAPQPTATRSVRERIGLDIWGELQRRHEAEDDACVYVPEERVAMARLEGWREMVLPPGPGHTIDRLIVVDREQTLGVPMYRPLPWKGLTRTAQRMLACIVRGKGSADHFQASNLDIVRVHMDHRMYGFWEVPGGTALALLVRSKFVRPHGEVLYYLTDDGRRTGEALLRVRGDAWLDEPNPHCREGWLS